VVAELGGIRGRIAWNPGGEEGGLARLLVVISGAPAAPHVCVVLILVVPCGVRFL